MGASKSGIGHKYSGLIASFVLIALSMLLCGAATAKMRIYNNVPLSDLPAAIRDSTTQPYLTEGFLDVRGAPYSASGDGITDDTAAIQAAIQDAYKYNFVVYFPRGTYLLSQQLRLIQGKIPPYPYLSQRKFAHIMVGEKSTGEDAPVLKLKDGTVLPGPLVYYAYERTDSKTGATLTEPERHYNAVFRGINIDMGNNPTQTALSMAGAQYCVIEDVKIYGSFNTGILNLPGSGGSVTNVEIVGGQIGILQNQYRPNPLITGLVLKGQSKFGIELLNSRGPLTIVGFNIEGPPSPAASYRAIHLKNVSTGDPASGNLNLMDGAINIAKPGLAAIENYDQDVYMRNVYVKADQMIVSGLRVLPSEILPGSYLNYKRILEYTFAGGTDNTSVVVDGIQLAHKKTDVAITGPVVTEDPAGDLISRHIWNRATFPDFREVGVVNITRDYGATPDNESDDDAPQIQMALNDTVTAGHPNYGKVVFIPRGHFHIKQPLLIPANAKVFGASNTISVIEISSKWLPDAPTAAIVTEDTSTGSVTLANFALLGHDPSASKNLWSHKYISHLVVQTNNALVRDVQFTAKEYFLTDNYYQEPWIVLKGNAGGRFYNMAVDLGNNHATGGMAPDYHLIAIRGTTNQIQLYEPDTEYMMAGPQLEISDSGNVFLYAFKYEKEHPLLLIKGSSNVAVLGGSGNYSLYVEGESAIVNISASINYLLANFARRPDTSNPRDRANKAKFSVVSDGVVSVPANPNNLTLFKSGEIDIRPQLATSVASHDPSQ